MKSSCSPGEPDLGRPDGALVLLGTKNCLPLELGEGRDVLAVNPGWYCNRIGMRCANLCHTTAQGMGLRRLKCGPAIDSPYFRGPVSP